MIYLSMRMGSRMAIHTGKEMASKSNHRFSLSLVVVVVMVLLRADGGRTASYPDYADALNKCLLFFEGQRSGKLPSSQRMTWRKDSALRDGRYLGVDLVGGYYDAGDNVKFGFPMAFTATILAWSIVEFRHELGKELTHAREALRWATDYLLKATKETNKVYVQVGEANADHGCWERPEDMDTPRTVFAVDTNQRGSEVAGETAAALAAASIAFKSSDPSYARQLLEKSMNVFDFANKYQGSYGDSLHQYVCPFYCDSSGYKDELIWGAVWIYKASGNAWYKDYVNSNIGHLYLNPGEFGWADKHAGIYVLTYGEKIANESLADLFACSMLPESPSKTVKYTPGGLLYTGWNGASLQSTVSRSFLLLVLGRYLGTTGGIVNCGNNLKVKPKRLIELARSQVDYILGNNPMGMSYMVGYGQHFPRKIHHRGSSLPSKKAHPHQITCKGGFRYYESRAPNPNLLIGAITGGPSATDRYADSRSWHVLSEPTTYTNAPMVALLAYFQSNTNAK